jgi:hypothetical protein
MIVTPKTNYQENAIEKGKKRQTNRTQQSINSHANNDNDACDGHHHDNIVVENARAWGCMIGGVVPCGEHETLKNLQYDQNPRERSEVRVVLDVDVYIPMDCGDDAAVGCDAGEKEEKKKPDAGHHKHQQWIDWIDMCGAEETCGAEATCCDAEETVGCNNPIAEML